MMRSTVTAISLPQAAPSTNRPGRFFAVLTQVIMFTGRWRLRRGVWLLLGNERCGRPMDRSHADFHGRLASQTLRVPNILFIFGVAEITVLYGNDACTRGRQDGLCN